MALQYPKTYLKASYPEAYAKLITLWPFTEEATESETKTYSGSAIVTTYADSTKDTPMFSLEHKITWLPESHLTHPKMYEILATLPEYSNSIPA